MKHLVDKLYGNYTEMLRALLNKSTALRPLTSHLTNHPRKTNKTCGTLMEEQGRRHMEYFPKDFHIWTCQG